MKTKILLLVTKSNMGGAQRYVFDLATGLPKDRYDVVVASGLPTQASGDGELMTRLSALGIPVITVPSLKRDISFIDEMRAFSSLKDIFVKERPDIVHLNSSKAGALGALAARSAGVKRIVFTAHGWPFREPRNFLWQIFVWFASLVTGLLVDIVITVSEKDKNTSPVPWKTVMVRNGIAPISFVPQSAARAEIALQAMRAIPKDVPWIGAVAELTKNKGLSYLIEAVKMVPRACLIIVGGGELRNDLETLSRHRGIGDRVFFTGEIADAARLLPAFDVFALPSLKEGFPYAILEAMAAGLPIVATKVGGVSEQIENGKSGILVPMENSRALAQALERLSEDPALSGKLGDAARERIYERFSLAEMLAATEKVYGAK